MASNDKVTRSKNDVRTYENIEYYEMVKMYFLAGGNLNKAQRMYAEPKHLEMLRKRGVVDPKIPNSRTIERVHTNLYEHGQFKIPTYFRDADNRKISLEVDEQIVKYIKKYPRHSITIVSNRFHVSKQHVANVFKDAGINRFQIAPKKIYSAITNEGKRVTLCRWLLDNPSANILWMDESRFSDMNIYNSKTHFYSKKNPNIVEENPTTLSITVWAAVINDVIIGPIFFEENLTGELYLDLLKNKLPNLLEELPMTYVKDLYYQHNGNPVHCHKIVRKYVNKEFGERWIGKDGPIPWPPKTEDLSPMSVYVWPQVRKYVYIQEFQTVKELKECIKNAFEKLKKDKGKLEQARTKILKKCANDVDDDDDNDKTKDDDTVEEMDYD